MNFRNQSDIWTDERVVKLKSLWAADELSTAEIAGRLGPDVTKAAVIGKAFRLKLQRKNFGHWTEEENEALRVGRLDGKSSREMANTIGRGRDAINQQLRKLGLSVARNTDKVNQQKKTDPKPGKPIETRGENAPISQRRSLLELTDDTCRWPCAPEGEEQWFCGAQIEAGKPYCGPHCRRAFIAFSPVRARPHLAFANMKRKPAVSVLFGNMNHEDSAA